MITKGYIQQTLLLTVIILLAEKSTFDDFDGLHSSVLYIVWAYYIH